MDQLIYSKAWTAEGGTQMLPAAVDSEQAARENLQIQHDEARDKINEIVNSFETSLSGSQSKIPTSAAVRAAINVSIVEQVQADWDQTDTEAKDYIKNKPNIPSEVSIDTALSSTSTNPVQNRVIKSALDGKAASSHTHAGVPVVYLNGTALTGTPKIFISTTEPSGASDGDIWLKYEA